jgi:hypothetical protein
MSLLHPYLRRNIVEAIAKARKSTERGELAHHVRDAGSLIKQQLRETEQELVKVMQIQVARRKELLALLEQLNTVTAEKIESLK